MAEHETTKDASFDALPRSNFLNYLATVNTPTRVRVIAARSTIVLSCVFLLAGIVIAVRLALIIRVAVGLGFVGRVGLFAIPAAAPPPPVTFADYLNAAKSMFSDAPLPFVADAVFFFCGVMAILCAGPVRCGKRFATRVMFILATPLMIALLLGSTAFACGAIIKGFGFLAPRDLFDAFLLALPVPVGVLLTLLLLDFCSFLFWIARHPITEKPPVPFSPGKPIR